MSRYAQPETGGSMKKILILAAAAFFALSAQANAENIQANVVAGNGYAELSTIFFDYEDGVWHGAPVEKVSDLKAWKNIDLKKYKIVLPDGRELGVLDNKPAVMENGKLTALK